MRISISYLYEISIILIKMWKISHRIVTYLNKGQKLALVVISDTLPMKARKKTLIIDNAYWVIDAMTLRTSLDHVTAYCFDVELWCLLIAYKLSLWCYRNLMFCIRNINWKYNLWTFILMFFCYESIYYKVITLSKGLYLFNQFMIYDSILFNLNISRISSFE